MPSLPSSSKIMHLRGVRVGLAPPTRHHPRNGSDAGARRRASGRRASSRGDLNEVNHLPCMYLKSPGVLLPTQEVMVIAHEPRYRAMFSDDVGVGGVFGHVASSALALETSSGENVSLGTCARVKEIAETENGRMLVHCEGLRRFRLTRREDEGVYPRAEIAWFDDCDVADEGGTSNDAYVSYIDELEQRLWTQLMAIERIEQELGKDRSLPSGMAQVAPTPPAILKQKKAPSQVDVWKGVTQTEVVIKSAGADPYEVSACMRACVHA